MLFFVVGVAFAIVIIPVFVDVVAFVAIAVAMGVVDAMFVELL